MWIHRIRRAYVHGPVVELEFNHEDDREERRIMGPTRALLAHLSEVLGMSSDDL